MFFDFIMKKALTTIGYQSLLSPPELDYQDSNLDKQNQNLLCYHYTISQYLCAMGISQKRCKGNTRFLYYQIFSTKFFIIAVKLPLGAILSGYNEEIILLTLLYDEVFSGYEVAVVDHLVECCEFLFVDRNATALGELAHFAF